MTNKPWENEPDFEEWVDEETGYLCEISRGDLKVLRGYVELPITHPMYRKDSYEEYEDIAVHGGVTFCDFKGDKHFWVGFDCGHAGDFLPSLPYNLYQDPSRYKDINYVIRECKSLAKQLKALETN